MANKKKKRKPRPPRPATGPRQAQQGGANVARRERKDQARAAKETERKRAARSATLRRAAIALGVGIAAFGVLWWLQRASAPRPLPAAATNAITAAGCRYDSSPSSDTAGGRHLAEGASTTYPSIPATTGQHDPNPLPSAPRVYTEPVPETRAVHFLEHSGVIAYYEPGDGRVGKPIIDRLTSLANDSKNLIVAPRADLPDDTAFSATAWNKVVNCGPDLTPDQAAAITRGFVEAFACTSNAPEPNQGEDC